MALFQQFWTTAEAKPGPWLPFSDFNDGKYEEYRAMDGRNINNYIKRKTLGNHAVTLLKTLALSSKLRAQHTLLPSKIWHKNMGDSVGKMWVEGSGMLLDDYERTKKNGIRTQKHELQGVKTQLGYLSTLAKETKAGVDNAHSKLRELTLLLRLNNGRGCKRTQASSPRGYMVGPTKHTPDAGQAHEMIQLPKIEDSLFPSI